MSETWLTTLSEALRGGMLRLATVLPSVLAALTFVIGGAVIGSLIRRGAVRVLAPLDRWAQEWGLDQALARAGLAVTWRELVGRFLFWNIFLIFALFGLDVLSPLGMGSVSMLAIRALPHLVAAGLMLLVGWLVANFLGHAVLIAGVNAQLGEARVLARAVRIGILTFAVAMALVELGIGAQMVLVAFGIAFGGLVFALALAFGLGGRHVARRILERRFGPARERVREEPDHMVHL